MIVPTRRLALAAFAIAPLWLLSDSAGGMLVASLAVAALTGAILLEAMLIPPAGRVSLVREAPAIAGFGDDNDISYSLTSEWHRPLRVMLFEKLPPELHADARAPLPFLLGRSPVAMTTHFRPVARGRHRLGPVTLRIPGPLGLLERSARRDPGGEVAVAPSMAPVRRFRLRALQARTREAGPRVLRHRGESLSFAGLRAYTPGDDPRRIDWKATARQGVPIIREYNLEQGQTVLLAVDAGRLMTQREGESTRFEHALSSVLALATVAADAGDRVGLVLFDDRVRSYLPPAPGMPAVRAIRAALIGIEPTMVEPDYAAAFATIAVRQRRRALVVLFSDVIDARSSRSLIAHTTRSALRHLHLVVALRSEALFRIGRPSPRAGADALYVNAAAEELVLAREEALLRMRRSGVAVVDVPTAGVTAAVVDRYLEIKGRGAL